MVSTRVEVMAAHEISGVVPNRGGVPFSAFTSDCDDGALVGLSVEFMVQHGRD